MNFLKYKHTSETASHNINLELKILNLLDVIDFYELFLNETFLCLTGDRGRQVNDSHKNLFGESALAVTPAKNRLHSNIPIGGNDAPDSNGNSRENGYGTGSEKSN